jgi:hypothetical protein
MPVRDALFVARGGRADSDRGSGPTRLNGGFEEISGGAPSGFVSTEVGELARDSAVYHGGKRPLQFDCRKRSRDDPGMSDSRSQSIPIAVMYCVLDPHCGPGSRGISAWDMSVRG